MAAVKMKTRDGKPLTVDESIVGTLAMAGYMRADGKPVQVAEAAPAKAAARVESTSGSTASAKASKGT